MSFMEGSAGDGGRISPNGPSMAPAGRKRGERARIGFSFPNLKIKIQDRGPQAGSLFVSVSDSKVVESDRITYDSREVS